MPAQTRAKQTSSGTLPDLLFLDIIGTQGHNFICSRFCTFSFQCNFITRAFVICFLIKCFTQTIVVYNLPPSIQMYRLTIRSAKEEAPAILSELLSKEL